MATSPLFGWEEPDDTDLVKDGAAAIRTLGNAIDTSMGDLLGGTSGQILAKNSNTNMDFTWITNDVGDITAVTAGTGISGGGTSGAVTITNSMATEITAKGDLIAGTGSATFDNLPVGTNGQTLVADSTAATGLKWETPSGSSGPAFRATPGATIQTGVSAGTFTKVTLGTETFDTDTDFASSRFTPTKAGYYQFNMTADMISTTLANQYMGRLYINGAAVNIFACYEGATTSADGQWIGSGSEVYYMNGTTDYAELYAYVGGGTVSFGVQSRFSGVWIRS